MTEMLPRTKSGGSRVSSRRARGGVSRGDGEEPQGAAETAVTGDPERVMLPARGGVWEGSTQRSPAAGRSRRGGLSSITGFSSIEVRDDLPDSLGGGAGVAGSGERRLNRTGDEAAPEGGALRGAAAGWQLEASGESGRVSGTDVGDHQHPERRRGRHPSAASCTHPNQRSSRQGLHPDHELNPKPSSALRRLPAQTHTDLNGTEGPGVPAPSRHPDPVPPVRG